MTIKLNKSKVKKKKSRKRTKAISAGTVNPIHEIPSASPERGKDIINLSIISGWDDLTVNKQKYLVEFSKENLKKKRAAIKCGLDPSEIKIWLHEDPIFSRIFEDIIDLHAEGIEEMDYKASFSPKNNTSRGRFLDKRSKIYKEREKEKQPVLPPSNNTTNILAVLNSEETTQKGLAGVAQVFNKMKDQGELPVKSKKE